MERMIGSPRSVPCPSGDQASIAIWCSAQKARTSFWVRYGCTSIWLTAGVIWVSPCSRRRWWGWKLETPMDRDAPPAIPGRQRPVDQEQVDVPGAERQRGAHRGRRVYVDLFYLPRPGRV